MNANLPVLSESAVIAQFIGAMNAAGLRTDAVIIADGELHRFRVEGDKAGTKNGYYALHLDGISSGFFGSWKHGISQSWCAINRDEMTTAQRDENRRRMDAAREASRVLVANKHRDAAAKAVRLWNEAKPAPADFPYLVNKGIKPGIARIKGDELVLPVIDVDGSLKSLQFIGEDGSKRFLSGGQKKACFIVVNDPEHATRIIVCEGYATGMTLAEHDPTSTVIAGLDAGNLEPVALALRTKHPDADIVIAMDFDEVGRAKGEQAARAVGGLVLPPPDNLPPEITDWNDYAALVLGGAQ